MKKKNLIGLAIVVTAIALLLETGILNYVNEKNASMTSQVFLLLTKTKQVKLS